MAALDLIGLLQGVRERGPDRWSSKCPGPLHDHGDRHPSLAVSRAENRWLIHCYTGCLPVDIMRALGLELADLFDDRVYKARGDQVRPRLSANEALAALSFEVSIVGFVAADMISNRTIDAEDWKRLCTAKNRIQAAKDLCCPKEPLPERIQKSGKNCSTLGGRQ